MPIYAENTSVPSERSRAEIERILCRYGADGFMYGWSDGSAVIAFQMNGKRIKFMLPLPDMTDFETTETGRSRKASAVQASFEQAQRQRWRALALVIKAKLEAVESGITVFEEEFMAHIMMPDGLSVGQHLLPKIEEAYRTGKLPPLLPGPE